ncbi:MAG: ATP-binding protein [Desulfomonilaceae bacterium]
MVASKRLDSLFCEMMESILIIDSSKGSILWTNPCACVTFGFENGEFVGQHFTCLFPPGSEIEAAHVLNEVVCADGVFVTQSFKRKDGNVLYMDLTASLIPWDGESTAILAVLREASERKELEELRLESERLKSFSELSAGVAHHFNNMLQVIIGFAGLAKTELESSETSGTLRKLEQIIVSATTAASAIRSLQEFSRCGQAIASLSRDIVDLKILTKRAIDLCVLWWKTRTDNSKIAISIVTDLKEDCYARVNQDHILEVMTNLIKNAVESLSEAGTIEVGVNHENDEAVFFVRDSGIGINKDDLKRIFDPFWTTKGPRKSGLGLASSLGIVKQNGGVITVESSEGQGSVFKVRFPLITAPDNYEPGKLSEAGTRRMTVLVIDEEEKVLEALGSGLISQGNVVHTVSTIQEGFKILDTNDVDIIISDEAFKDISGWNFGRELKRRFSEINKEKPRLILLTAWGIGKTHSEKMKRTGVDCVLAKPITIEKLIHHMREILSGNI